MKKVVFASIAAVALALPAVAFAAEEAKKDATPAAAAAAPAAGETSYTLEDGKKVTVKGGIAWLDGKAAPKGDWKTKEGKTLHVTGDKGAVEIK